jgi:probable HAF family extracellular repeat protein
MALTIPRTLAGVALGLLWLAGLPGAASAQYYHLTPIEVPGAINTLANGLSTHAIVGEFEDDEGTHGFVLEKGVFTRFDVPGASFTSVNGVNASGDLVGRYTLDGRSHGYLWSKGALTTLDPPGSVLSFAFFLNAKGQVAGYSRDAGGTRHGFVWHKGVFTTIDAPGAGPGGTRIIGINDRGDVVGTYQDATGQFHGFLLSGGVFTTLDAPGSNGFTVAEGINNRGHIVGAGADEATRGFVLIDGVYTLIEVPGAVWTDVYAINNKGEIVGAYEDAEGIHGFLGTPARGAKAATPGD